MQEKEINEIVERSFKTIHKLLHKIIKDFDADDIHNFRIEVKKIRAFLRLADFEKKIDGPLIPKRLKTLNGYIGIVRNIQLHRHSIFKYITNNKIEVPAAYIEMLVKEKAYWQKEAADLMEENDFKEDEGKIIKHLPGELNKSSIKAFVKDKLDKLKEQLNDMNDDDAIHNIRKILKDILYNLEIVKDHADLPGIISKEVDLKSLTSMLGDFRDKCIELEFLQPEYLDKIKDPEEKARLVHIKNDFEKDKQNLKQQLQNKLEELQDQL